MTRKRIHLLFATSECEPWIKTGGLADVSAALPTALESHGIDVRVLMPGYRSVLAAARDRREVAKVSAAGPFPPAILYEAPLPTGVPAWLLHCPALYDRDGGPYQDPTTGEDWPDNAVRFGLLAHVAALLASGRSPVDWSPSVLHCNDWQTALAPAYLRLGADADVAVVFCIHNLAFQGLFPANVLDLLDLPASSFNVDGVEFYGRVSFLKAGVVYADAITTVSPTYAREIQQKPLGFGLQDLLAARASKLRGILNGIDTATWDPAIDPHIAQRYDASRLAAKHDNKRALQARVGLPPDDVPLFGFVGRLTEQKGADLITEIAPRIAAMPAQLALVGTGTRRFEAALSAAADVNPAAIAVKIGFDEPLAHLIEAGADALLMPSQFEPCGLNQMYSQRYGTPPIAHATGGLCDSIVDCSATTLADGTATGFLFRPPTADAFLVAIERAAAAYRVPQTWRALQRNGMARDFSWDTAARAYAELYESLVR